GFDDLLAARGGQGVILSMHDFEGVPHDLEARASAMRSTGAEVIKLAAMATRLSDCLPFLTIGRESKTPIVLVAMGESGTPTRVLATRFGSCWTYAGDAVVPGQLTACALQDEFCFRSLTNRTALYGVVGRPVAHSLSPAMHNAAFKAARLDAVYLPLAAADFADFQWFAEVMGIEGASVTAPFKVDAFESAAESDPVSRRIRSVNTLRHVNQRWAACNTDVAGFLKPLQARMPVEGRRTTILGAGGAARAVAEALHAAGARVSIAARARERAEETARLSGAAVADWPPRRGSWDVLVNATPVGTAPDLAATPLPDGPFTGDLVYDLVYNTPTTQLLRDARAAGCQTLGGLSMLVAQAELQFEWWTGQRPTDRVMRDAAMAALGRQTPTGTPGTL
ncbi:MAG: type I 3-dehydroquinate dehydratase, partial [Vicinamibacterales bacterium]